MASGPIFLAGPHRRRPFGAGRRSSRIRHLYRMLTALCDRSGDNERRSFEGLSISDIGVAGRGRCDGPVALPAIMVYTSGGARMPQADLVLEGGGVKGIALVGAIEVLEE